MYRKYWYVQLRIACDFYHAKLIFIDMMRSTVMLKKEAGSVAMVMSKREVIIGNRRSSSMQTDV